MTSGPEKVASFRGVLWTVVKSLLSPGPCGPEVLPEWMSDLLLWLGYNFYGHPGRWDWSLAQMTMRLGCNCEGLHVSGCKALTIADPLLCAGAYWGCPLGMAGQESLWKGASLDGSSGKCQDGVNSVSNVNEKCQKWHLPESEWLGGKRIKKGDNGSHQHFSLWSKFQQVPDSPSTSTHSNVRPCIAFT